jgi:hypothetical protein
MARQKLGDCSDKFVLLALKPIGIGGDIREEPEIELGDHPLLAPAKLPSGAQDAHVMQLSGYAALLEHFERGRMKSRGPRVVINRRPALEHRDIDVSVNEEERSSQPCRSGADDNDICSLGHVR